MATAILPPSGAVVYVPLSMGHRALVDERDWQRIKHFTWCLMRNGQNRTRTYAIANVKDGSRKNGFRSVSMHIAIFGRQPGLEIDHINGDGLDNRRENVRFATHQQNMWNKGVPTGVSKYKGVDKWAKGNRAGLWRAQTCHGRKKIFIGTFECEEDAAKAYDVKARELFGEYAYLNFPDWRGAAPKSLSAEFELPSGVKKVASGRFVARYVKNGKTRHLGTFDTPEEAHATYLAEHAKNGTVPPRRL